MGRIRQVMFTAGFALVLMGLAPGSVWGQSAQSSSLVGKVTDESGGAMPGVTITAKSPALQVPQMTTVSGVDGDYHLLELPPGTYTVEVWNETLHGDPPRRSVTIPDGGGEVDTDFSIR